MCPYVTSLHWSAGILSLRLKKWFPWLLLGVRSLSQMTCSRCPCAWSVSINDGTWVSCLSLCQGLHRPGHKGTGAGTFDLRPGGMWTGTCLQAVLSCAACSLERLIPDDADVYWMPLDCHCLLVWWNWVVARHLVCLMGQCQSDAQLQRFLCLEKWVLVASPPFVLWRLLSQSEVVVPWLGVWAPFELTWCLRHLELVGDICSSVVGQRLWWHCSSGLRLIWCRQVFPMPWVVHRPGLLWALWDTCVWRSLCHRLGYALYHICISCGIGSAPASFWGSIRWRYVVPMSLGSLGRDRPPLCSPGRQRSLHCSHAVPRDMHRLRQWGSFEMGAACWACVLLEVGAGTTNGAGMACLCHTVLQESVPWRSGFLSQQCFGNGYVVGPVGRSCCSFWWCPWTPTITCCQGRAAGALFLWFWGSLSGAGRRKSAGCAIFHCFDQNCTAVESNQHHHILVAKAWLLGETTSLVGVYFEEGFVVLDVVHTDENFTFLGQWMCAFFFCFMLADKNAIPAWLARGWLLATFGLLGMAFDCFLGFGEVLGHGFGC